MCGRRLRRIGQHPGHGLPGGRLRTALPRARPHRAVVGALNWSHAAASGTIGGMSAHVVFIGIDGVRLDTMSEARTPTLDRLAAQGFLRQVTVNAAGPTISG